MKKITKAVFPVAGLGTRFLPATKAIPKEMLPIIDKPLIEYAVEEAVNAGINEIIFITSHTKRAIEDHFDQNFELEEKLINSGKKDFVNKIYCREVNPFKPLSTQNLDRTISVNWFTSSFRQDCIYSPYHTTLLDKSSENHKGQDWFAFMSQPY